MATALQSFRLTARSCKCQSVAQRYATKSIGRRRTFSTAPLRWKEQDDTDARVNAVLEKAAKDSEAEYGKWLGEQVATFEQQMKETEESAKAAFARAGQAPTFDWERIKVKTKNTFLNMGETDPVDGFPDDEEDNEEDITSLAHGELEHHREMRHYARLAAWEMPMLSSKCSRTVIPITFALVDVTFWTWFLTR
jgi:small subunit ribosomal protein S35